MSYRVEWLQSALDELADLWSGADSVERRAITSAADSIDQRLRIDPAHAGESRADGRRVLFVAPIAVTFAPCRKTGS